MEKPIKILCKGCKIKTNHNLISEKSFEWTYEGMWGQNDHQLLICDGCDSVTYRQVSMNSEDKHPSGSKDKDGKIVWELDEAVTLYPPRHKVMISPIRLVWHLPVEVREVYMEVIDSFNSKIPRLCGIGIRMLIETICNHLKIKKGDLIDRINLLHIKNLVSTNLSDGLQESRFVGNDCAHKAELFSYDELEAAFSLIDALINEIYILPKKVTKLKKRNSRKKKK